MSLYKTKRQIESYWRSPGNARLKALMAAHPEIGGEDPKEVAKAWPGESKRRELTKAVPGGQPRTLAKASYSPGSHENIRDSYEENTIRTLYDGEERDKVLSGEKTVDRDRYLKRALANDSVTNTDILFREELMESILQGAEPAKLARDMSNVFSVNKRTGDHPRGPDQRYAQTYSQGAEINSRSDGFDTYRFETEKLAEGYEITNELIAESEPDVLEWLVRHTGENVENALNRQFITALVEDAADSNDVDADVGGDDDLSAAQAWNYAQTEIDVADFGPADTAVGHPYFTRSLFEDTNIAYANRYGNSDGIQERQAQRVMGLDHDVAASSALDPGSDETWDYRGEGEIGSAVYPQEFVHTLIWMDLDMEDYEDPVRHLVGGNAYMYSDVQVARPEAVSRVFHSTA